MADRTMSMKVLHVTKSTAEWASWEAAELTAGRSAVITRGILCIELDTSDNSWAKVGDGVHKYSELPYITDGAIAALGNLFSIKGVVATTSQLPATGNKAGDVYFVGPKTGAQGSDQYSEYVWTTAGAWEYIGEVSAQVTVVTYTLGNDSATKGTGDHINDLVITMTCSDGTSTNKYIKIGSNLSIASDGTLSATDTTYSISDPVEGTGADAGKLILTLDASAGSDTTAKFPSATTSAYGVTKLSSATDSSSEALAATPKAVKAAYDLANGKSTVSVSGLESTGTSIGTITVNGTANSIKVPNVAITTSSATSDVDLVPNTKYQLSAGGSSIVFKTPAGSVTDVQINTTSILSSGVADIKVDGTYNASTNKIATSSTVTNAIGALDVSDITANLSASKTITALSETDGKISATASDIAIGISQVTDLSFDGTYNSSTNKAATVATVTNAINALDVSNITANLSASKTITALSETDGKIAATASDIAIGVSQVTDLAFDGTYNSSSNKAATVSTVSNAVSSKLDVNDNITINCVLDFS